MRSNAIKSCAVGAMLFGGTLGVSGQAAAGLTWNTSGGSGSGALSTSNDALSYDGNGGALYSTGFGAYSGSLPGASGATSISFSAITSSGYSVAVSDSTANGYVNVIRLFTVTDTQQITISRRSLFT